MTIDNNKGISQITYNHLNLPTKIVFNNNNNTTITYLYNSVGQKVSKTVLSNNPSASTPLVTTTNYLSGFQYVGTALQFFPHAEGYVNVRTGPAYNYVFNYTDHLGNVRVSYAKDAVTNVLRIMEENHYYAFGLKHSNYNTDVFVIAEQGTIKQLTNPLIGIGYKYKYNGKVLQDELGLNMYDYGARNYDAALGRWMNVDPLAEKYESFTPYNYTGNNPVFFIDVNGEYIYVNDPNNNNKQYRYQNGTTQHQVDGNWVDIDENTQLSSFVLNTVAGLYHLENLSKTGKGLIDKFSSSENDVTFSFSKEGDNFNSGKIGLDHKNLSKTFVQTKNGYELQNAPLFVTIAHELAHAADPTKLYIPDGWYYNNDGTKTSLGEIYATHVENIIRHESGQPLRSHYGATYNSSTGQLSPKPVSILIDKSGQSIYFDATGNKYKYLGEENQARATINAINTAVNGGILDSRKRSRFNYNNQ